MTQKSCTNCASCTSGCAVLHLRLCSPAPGVVRSCTLGCVVLHLRLCGHMEICVDANSVGEMQQNILRGALRPKKFRKCANTISATLKLRGGVVMRMAVASDQKRDHGYIKSHSKFFESIWIRFEIYLRNIFHHLKFADF